jgi:hypothetical protein
MSQTIQVGTILIEDHPRFAERLGIKSEPYTANWRMIEGVDALALDRKIHAAGWNFFSLAGEVRSLFFGTPQAGSIRKALKRMLAKVSQQNFNCLEVKGIASRRFAGVPYTIISAYRRHIQKGWQLDESERRGAGKDAK